MSPDDVSVVLRALSLVTMLQAAGVSLFIVAFGRHLADSATSIRRTGAWSAFAAGPLLLAQFSIEAARMADDWSGIADTALQSLAMTSSNGAVLGSRVLGLCLVAVGLRQNTSRGRVVSMIGVVLIAGSFALTGHTSEHRLRALLAPLLFIHVLIVAFWFGSLLPLYLATQRETASRAAQAVEAFSAVATWLVPTTAVAGLAMTLVFVRNFDAFRHPYGALLIGKAAAFTALMGLAALNKWRLAPAIATDERVGPTFRRSLAMEYSLITTVLVGTAVMTTFFSPEPS